MHSGSLAIAVVQRQVVLVQATRSHHTSERYIDVNTFSPFGIGLFLQTSLPKPCKIKRSDILRVVDVPSIPYLDCACLSELNSSTSSLGHHGSCHATPYNGGFASDSASTLESDEGEEPEIIEVSPRVYREFLALQDAHGKKLESLWKRLAHSRR